ncbi:MAG: helix-turn-helix domain-containing protein [Coriobacteriaceae bacterium]|nr:helix-turn-helix domain-containing protein [Coriobacteriaceae bacterium]MCI6845355.1 helix-turn-helix domain-containing protein [Coriobacteriaceae bacterium]MDD7584498.1 helix-turn-helix transcriptional regulator [Coriobacteriaceae bacterium]
MDYYGIGRRVRRYRKACGLSQERLAELVGISVTHMSHIETGNTKLSLPVFARIADALSVSTDALLHEAPKAGREAISDEVSELLESSSPSELSVILDVARATRAALRKHAGEA